MKYTYELIITNTENDEPIKRIWGQGQWRTEEIAINQIRKDINNNLKEKKGAN